MAWKRFVWVDRVTQAIADRFNNQEDGIEEALEASAAETTRATAAEAAKLDRAANLGDVLSAPTARANLGLGTASTHAATDFDAAGSAASTAATERARAEAAEATKAPLASPALTGSPTAPTAAEGDASTKLATTAYADRAAATAVTTAEGASDAAGVAAAAVATERTRAETAEALKAPLASAALTGNPTAPTQGEGDASTRLATTAYADRAADEGREDAEAVSIPTAQLDAASGVAKLGTDKKVGGPGGSPLSDSVASGSPTGKLKRARYVDPTAAPYNGSTEGADITTAVEEALADIKSEWLHGRRLPLLFPEGALGTSSYSYLLSKELELFNGLAIVGSIAGELLGKHVVLQNSATNMFKFPAGSSGRVTDVYMRGLRFNGNGEQKNTDFIARQPLDGTGWDLFEPVFERCAWNFFAATFSGAFDSIQLHSPNIANCGLHTPMTAHAYSASTKYLAKERVYYEGFVFEAVAEIEGTAPKVTAGVPETSAQWTWVVVPMVACAWSGSDAIATGRGYIDSSFPSQLPLGGQLVPTFRQWFQMSSTRWRDWYSTNSPAMGVYATSDCDRSVIDFEQDGYSPPVELAKLAEYNAGTTYAKFTMVKFEGKPYVSLKGGFSGQAPSGTEANTEYWAFVPNTVGTDGCAVYVTGLTGEGLLRLEGTINKAAQKAFGQYDSAVAIYDSSNVEVALRAIKDTAGNADDIKIATSAGGASSDGIIIRRTQAGGTAKPMRVRLAEGGGGHAITNAIIEDMRPGVTPVVTANAGQRERVVYKDEALTPNASTASVFVYVLKAALATRIVPTFTSFTNGATYTFVFEQDEIGGHAYKGAWPAKIKWLNQAEPWDGTPRSRVAVTFKYNSGTEELEEVSRTVNTGQKKYQSPMAPKSGEYKTPLAIEVSTTASVVGDKNLMRLQRYEGAGQTFTKMMLNVTAARKKGAGFVAKVAAYADDGTGSRPALATPLAVLGTITIDEAIKTQTENIAWTEPEGPYWIGVVLQWTENPETFPTFSAVKSVLLPGAGVEQIRAWRQTAEVAGEPGKLTAFTADGSLRPVVGLGV